LNLIKINRFIRDELPKKLLSDLRILKIVKEADIECATYFHLRHFFGDKDTQWRVFARKHTPATGHFIDLLIFNNETPVIAIELKWAKRQITKKDRSSLEKALDNLGVQKSYWITMTTDEKQEKPKREPLDNNRLFQIIIPLGYDKSEKSEWTKKRRLFRQDMKNGKRNLVKPDSV
jgi:hypothetical protein